MEQLQKWFEDLDMKMYSGEKLNKSKQCNFKSAQQATQVVEADFLTVPQIVSEKVK